NTTRPPGPNPPVLFGGGTREEGHCAEWDKNGNLVSSGDPCGIGSASLPSQTGQTGKFLQTDGTNLSWGLVSYSALLDLPVTFPPSAHTHSASEVTTGTF